MATVIKNACSIAEDPNQPFLSVAGAYVRKPKGIQKMVVQPALRSLKWIDLARAGLSKTGKEGKRLLGVANQWLYCFDLPEEIRKFKKAAVCLKKSFLEGTLWDISKSSQKTLLRSALVIDTVAGSIEILSKEKLIALSPTQIVILDVLGFLGCTALFIQTMRGLKKEIHKFINAEIGSREFKLSLLKMMAKTCLACVCFFGMATFMAGEIIAHVVVLTFSSLFLILSLSSYFYEKMRPPKKKNPIAPITAT